MFFVLSKTLDLLVDPLWWALGLTVVGVALLARGARRRLGVGLAAAFFAGFGMAGRKVFPMLHAVGFATIVAGTVYVTIDLEYPRQGLVRVDEFDRALVEVRATMK